MSAFAPADFLWRQCFRAGSRQSHSGCQGKRSGCQTDVEEAGEEDTAEALRKERDELSARMQRTGRDLGSEIEELDRKLEKASAKEKARWQERRKKLAAERR